LITNTFIPGTDVCTDLGLGYEYSLDYRSGTANPYSVQFGTGTNGTVNKSVELGPGLPSAPSLHAGQSGEENSHVIKACTQTSTGAIICKEVTTDKTVTSGEISWREPLDK
jgi:type IV pilus assembly protein PilY1